jgi:uncharacterized membrane protein
MVLVAAWLLKISLHPQPVTGIAEMVERAALGGVSGSAIVLAVGLALATVAAFALVTIPLRQASGEIVPRFGDDARSAVSKRGVGRGGVAGAGA